MQAERQPPAATTPDLDPPTHPMLIGYLFWTIGFTGAHRFYFGKPLTGILWFLTGGLFLVGWIIDAFLMPDLAREANHRYHDGPVDHTTSWMLHTCFCLGIFGVHRFYMGKLFTGLLFLFTGGLLGLGFAYDALTLNEQVEELNATSRPGRMGPAGAVA